MNEPSRPWMNAGWVTAFISIAGILLIVGAWTNQNLTSASKGTSETADNTRRILALETRDTTRGDALARIDSRTARIEATLEMMTGRREYRPLSEPVLP